MLKPPALSPGDYIALVAPASPLDAARVKTAVENLRQEGYGVKVAYDTESREGYLAGTDAQRAAALNGMLRDPDVKAIICVRGGYGSPRILDRIDYPALRRQPKIVIGYSDVTALLVAFQRRSRVVVFHGPMGKEWSSRRGLTPFSGKLFSDMLQGKAKLGRPWGTPPAGAPRLRTLAPGKADGVLTGGNLSVLCATTGTRYAAPFEGSILFLEDVSEKPFRIDRMLNQLRLAGILGNVRGVLLGSFTGCDELRPAGTQTVEDLAREYFLPLEVPVLMNYPAGHTADHATLPFGSRVRLDAGARTLTLLESPVALPPSEDTKVR